MSALSYNTLTTISQWHGPSLQWPKIFRMLDILAFFERVQVNKVFNWGHFSRCALDSLSTILKGGHGFKSVLIHANHYFI